MRSMTGYGRGTAAGEGCALTVEVSAVNSRKQVDIRFSIPKELGLLEPLFRQAIQKRISRGSLYVAVTLQRDEEAAARNGLRLNAPLALAATTALRALAKEADLPPPVLADVMAVPGVVNGGGQNGLGDAMKALAEAALEQAVDALMRDRDQEGARLKDDLRQRGELLRRLIGEIEARGPEALVQLQERLRARLQELSKELPVEEERLARELVFYAEKADITEEVIRLKSHLVKYFALLESDGEPGRELDFLGQEMNREITTLSSKTADLCIAENALTMKIEISKIREQVMNIE